MIRVLDPTNEMKAAGIEPAPRLPSSACCVRSWALPM
jgi:hypothetical protein